MTRASNHYSSSKLKPLWQDEIPELLSEELTLFRKQAQDDLLTQGIPSSRQESWKYTNLRSFSARSFSKKTEGSAPSIHDIIETLPSWLKVHLRQNKNLSKNTIFFVDGRPIGSWNDLEGVRLTSLTEGSQALALCQRFSQLGANSFTRLADATVERGFYLHVTTKMTEPLHVVHVMTSQAHQASLIRLCIEAASGAHATIIESHVSTVEARTESSHENSAFENVLTDLSVQPDATVQHVRLQHGQGITDRFAHTRAIVAERGLLQTFVGNNGDHLARLASTVDLQGSAARATQGGLFIVGENCHSDHHTKVIHSCADTSSDQLVKGVVYGNGRATFDGTVHIQAGSHGSRAGQLSKNLILSPQACINAKPRLIIDNDDVKCSHGMTIGQLRPDELFYLVSRGIPADRARNMLTRGFAADVIQRCCPQAVSKLVDDWLTAQLTNSLG